MGGGGEVYGVLRLVLSRVSIERVGCFKDSIVSCVYGGVSVF